MDAICALSDEAFGLAFNSKDESRLIRSLQADGDSLLSLVAEADDGRIVGHIEFFRILIDAKPVAAGLGPMSTKPGLQKTGIGSYLVRTSLAQVAHWLRDFQHETVPAADPARLAHAVEHLSTETQTPAGLIRHLRSAMTLQDQDGANA